MLRRVEGKDGQLAEGLKPLASYNLANAYRSFIMDEARAKSLRQKYEAFTGPVTGSGTYR